MSDPRAFLRRSPLLEEGGLRNALWRDLPDAAIADSVPGDKSAMRVALCDLSPLPRLGFKGRGTIDAMKKRGIAVEATPNLAYRQGDGGLCLVLAPGEVILLSNLEGEGGKFNDWQRDWRIEHEERTYPLLRRDSHAWFAVSGPDAPLMFSKICAIDMRPHKFADLSIAQTSVARLSAIIVRADLGNRLFYHVLADSAAALYFCSALLDAAAEFGGRLVGLGDIRDIQGAWPRNAQDPA